METLECEDSKLISGLVTSNPDTERLVLNLMVHALNSPSVSLETIDRVAGLLEKVARQAEDRGKVKEFLTCLENKIEVVCVREELVNILVVRLGT